MITPDMCYPIHVTGSNECNGCKGCIARDNVANPELCMSLPSCRYKIYKLKREYKPRYRTPPANYRDSENDLS